MAGSSSDARIQSESDSSRTDFNEDVEIDSAILEESISKLMDDDDEPKRRRQPSQDSNPSIPNPIPPLGNTGPSIWGPVSPVSQESPRPQPGLPEKPKKKILTVEEVEQELTSGSRERRPEMTSEILPAVNQLLAQSQQFRIPVRFPMAAPGFPPNPPFSLPRPLIVQRPPPGYLPPGHHIPIPFLPPLHMQPPGLRHLFHPGLVQLPPQQQQVYPVYPQERPYYNHREVEFSSATEEDPFAGLMTQKEKDFIVKIQIRQLQGTNPYLDDFYYQTYLLKKKQQQESEAESDDDGDKKDKASNTRFIIPQIEWESREYQPPVPEEGSLGKVSVSSVSSPRKLIDATSSGGGSTGSSAAYDVRRRLLMKIECCYNDILDVDELKKKAQARPDSDIEFIERIDKRRRRLEKEFAEGGDEEFVHMMSIGKGRRAVGRILDVLGSGSAGEALVLRLFRHLAVIVRRDEVEKPSCLSGALPSIRRIIKSSSVGFLVQLFDSVSCPDVFTSEFCCKVLLSAVHHGSQEESSSGDGAGAWTTSVSGLCERFSVPSGVSVGAALSALIKALVNFEGLSDGGNMNMKKQADLLLKEH
eukprot:m.310871 g.310871  ORF g.310871 m.310871 type:complete len:587 (+) comp55961_c0_seq1:70-1830(+)